MRDQFSVPEDDEGLNDTYSRTSLFLVHPVIADLSLAKASILMDVSPFLLRKMKGVIDPEVEKLGGIETRNQLDFWRSHLRGWYKFTDVPVSIYFDSSGLVGAERSDEGSMKYSSALRRGAFLDTQGFLEKNERWESEPDPNTPEFYPLVPYLAVMSHEIASMNALAEIVAIVRWAKQSGVTLLAGVIPPKREAGPIGSFKFKAELDQSITLAFGPPLATLLADNIMNGVSKTAEILKQAHAPSKFTDFDKELADRRLRWISGPQFIALTEIEQNIFMADAVQHDAYEESRGTIQSEYQRANPF